MANEDRLWSDCWNCLNSVGLSNCASSEILCFEAAAVVTAGTPTAVVDVSFTVPPCAPAALFELRSCLRRAFCGFAASFEVAGTFSSLSFCAWSAAATAVEGCVIVPPVAKVVVGAADVLLELADDDDGDEDDDIDDGRDWLKAETGGCGGGVKAAFFG